MSMRTEKTNGATEEAVASVAAEKPAKRASVSLTAGEGDKFVRLTVLAVMCPPLP